MSSKIGNYTYYLSERKGKKLKVMVNDKWIHFGSDMEHYYDKTGLLNKSLNHNDKKRRDNYLTRSKGIKDKEGNLTYKDVESPNYHSRKILW